MALTKTSIANAAMALLGQRRFTDVDTDGTENAAWVNDLWDNSLDEALRAHPWNFATWRVRLGENLLLQSEAFSNASWTKTNATVTADQIRAPDGESDADELDDSDGANAGTVAQSVTVPNNSDSHTLSVYLKEGTAAVTRVTIAYTGGTGVSTDVDVTWASVPTVSAGSIEEIGSGWWRVNVTLANNASGNTTLTATIYPAGATAASTGTVYAWGAQINQSAGPVGYVETTTAAIQPIYPENFKYGWPLPADFLRVVDVNEGDTNYAIEKGYLLTDDVSPTLRYVQQITTVTDFDVLFARALAAQLAKDLCLVLTGSEERMVRAERAWDRAVGAARTTDSQEDGQAKPIIPAWIAARRTA